MNKLYILALTFISIYSFGQTGGLSNVHIQTPQPICGVGECTEVTADFTNVKATTSYQVSAMPFAPFYPYIGGTQLFPTDDDRWSSSLNLPFSFCFYGQNYNKLLVGANGVVTFDIQNVVPGGTQVPGGTCLWNFSESIPSPTFSIKNAIYGVYQDTNIQNPPVTDPTIQNVNFYINGVAPNRSVIINFSELPQFQCNNSVGLQTSQIVLYETTNVIDVIIKNRSVCASWNSGNGLVGIQNQEGTMATVPPGRNTGNWSATNEAWQFTPTGDSNTAIYWKLNGVVLGNSNPITVCPTSGDVLEAVVDYTSCSGAVTSLTNQIQFNFDTVINNPLDLSVCVADSQPANFDLSQNTLIILNGLNASDYNVTYYTGIQPDVLIQNVTNFSSTGQTIFVLIENYVTGCTLIKQFDLIVNTIPAAPTGESMQAYQEGQTLADLVVEGNNIIWYSDEFGDTVLPSTTLLVDGVTYFAAQSNTAGCVSGKSTLNSGRLAVTVQNVLSTVSFDTTSFKTYPNPVKDILNLSYNKNISNVSIRNLLGQEVMSKVINTNQSQINLSNLSSGTYLVKVTVDGLVKTIKVVKE
jgi:hypothetical protein